jgi:hypothetical protein
MNSSPTSSFAEKLDVFEAIELHAGLAVFAAAGDSSGARSAATAMLVGEQRRPSSAW